MLVHSVRRVPPPKASSSHRISKPPQLYSRALGASARLTVVSETRGVGAPTVVSFTVLPTVPKLPSASNGAHSRKCAGWVSACQTFSGEWRSSLTRMSVHFSPSFRICAPLAGPGVYCSRSGIFFSLASIACQLRQLNQVAAGVLQHRNARAGHVGGRHRELGPARLDPFVVALDVVREEHRRRLALLNHRLLVRFSRGDDVQRQLQLSAIRLLGRGHGQPAIWALAEIGLLGKAQYLRIEAQGLALVVHVYACHFDFHFLSPVRRLNRRGVVNAKVIRKWISDPHRPRVKRSCLQRQRRSVDRGTCGPGIQPRKKLPPGRRRCRRKRKAPSGAPISRGVPESRAVRDPVHVRRHLAREPGDPKSAPGSSCLGTHREVQGRTPMTNGPGKSDSPVVPEKSPNNAGQPVAEGMEGSGLAKGNLPQQNASRTPSRTDALSALERVRQAAGKDKKLRFTALLHHIYNQDTLRRAYFRLKKEAAPGVDGETWRHYGEKLEENLQGLSDRLKRGAYRAKPVRRVFIPKADGRQRPLGVPALEDKIVQRAAVEVLNAIYETDFLGFSYGFRPGRSQHQALDALYTGLLTRKVNWV